MSIHTFPVCAGQAPPSDYVTAMTDIERRAFRGELTLAQLRHEIHALRERLAIDATAVARWAVPG